MKKTIISFFLLLAGFASLSAQKAFQGTVVYSYEVKGENAEMMQMMMPQKMVVKYGEKAMLTYMEGGLMSMMMGKIVVNTESGETFIVKDDEKTVYLMKKEDMENAETGTINSSSDEKETKEILGYKCKKYKVSMTQNEQEMTQYIWATEELKVPDFQAPGVQQMSGMMFAQHVKGFPLEVEISIPGMNTTMIMTVTELDKKKAPASEFVRPAEYATKDFSEFMKN